MIKFGPTQVGPASVRILQIVSTLGPEWRAKFLVKFAKNALAEYGENFPSDGKKLERLLPTGQYAARAVPIMVHGLGLMPIDQTIARLVNRYFGISATGDLRRNSKIKQKADDLGVVSKNTFLAVLDLANQICTPSKPKCDSCPMRFDCVYDEPIAPVL